MTPDLPPRYAPDAIFLARVARGKISRKSTHPDHELRLWVGHANMLAHLNHVILNAHEERISNRSNLHDVQQGSSPAKTESLIVSVERVSTWAGETKSYDGQGLPSSAAQSSIEMILTRTLLRQIRDQTKINLSSLSNYIVKVPIPLDQCSTGSATNTILPHR